jgi:hypothetical protein
MIGRRLSQGDSRGQFGGLEHKKAPGIAWGLGVFGIWLRGLAILSKVSRRSSYYEFNRSCSHIDDPTLVFKISAQTHLPGRRKLQQNCTNSALRTRRTSVAHRAAVPRRCGLRHVSERAGCGASLIVPACFRGDQATILCGVVPTIIPHLRFCRRWYGKRKEP